MELIKENKQCPFCKESLYVNIRSYANHVRWCKSNPEYEKIRNNTSLNVQKTLLDKYKNLHSDVKFVCEVCGKEYILNITENQLKRKDYKRTCSDKCAKKLAVQNTNIEDKNIKISRTLSTKQNGGICKCCGKPIKMSRVFCSNKCSSIYRFRKSLLYKDPLNRYRKQCEFKFRLSQFPEEFNFDLIKENGWYSAKNHGNNLHGVSRDHMYSVKEGFNNKVDPYLISHPANCQLLIHTDNESKCNKCSITLDELKERVRLWNIKYGEYPNKIIYN